MMMGHMLQSSAQSTADTVLRDLRGQLFDTGVIGAGNAGSAGVTFVLDATADGASSLLHYFSFMQGANASYKVALGLAEPEARTVEVVSTLTGGGKAVTDDAKGVVEVAPTKRWRVFTSGDFSFYDQNPLTDLIMQARILNR